MLTTHVILVNLERTVMMIRHVSNSQYYSRYYHLYFHLFLIFSSMSCGTQQIARNPVMLGFVLSNTTAHCVSLEHTMIRYIRMHFLFPYPLSSSLYSLISFLSFPLFSFSIFPLFFLFPLFLINVFPSVLVSYINKNCILMLLFSYDRKTQASVLRVLQGKYLAG